KIRLIQEQVDFLEEHFEGYQDFEIIDAFAKTHDFSNKFFHLDELIRAVYIGYEIIKEFKAGDWVVTSSGEIKQIASVQRWSKNTELEYIYNDGECTTVEPKRHATDEEIAGEKERNWWDKHNREVWELRKSD